MALDVGCDPAYASGGRPGWMAALRFSRVEPHRGRVGWTHRRRVHMTTRRWYYLIPATGEPRGIVHAIERHNLDALAGRTDRLREPRAARCRVDHGADRPLTHRHGILARVRDPVSVARRCGYAEAVRQRGVEIVSSGDLVQRFEACWSAEQLTSHEGASEALHRIKDRAFCGGGRGACGIACR